MSTRKRIADNDFQCQHCGQIGISTRRGSEYCSAKCRQAAYRLRKLRGDSDKLPLNDPALRAFIRAQCDDLLHLALQVKSSRLTNQTVICEDILHAAQNILNAISR